MKETKNDIAWNQLFDRYNILNVIERSGSYRISSTEINEYREARLMTKFDHSGQMPKIFSDNKVTILPDSRGGYVLGKFEVFKDIKYETIKPTTMKIPDFIRSVSSQDITSESIALNVAHMSQMIDVVLGTKENESKSILTLNGRMSSGEITYDILNSDKKLHKFTVKNAQIEIDGSYENNRNILVVEAKNKLLKDFNIRQLYYPLRMYQSLGIQKEIIPTFFTYVDGIFSFHVYHFSNIMNYSSLEKIKQLNFILNTSLDITLDEIQRINYNIKKDSEHNTVPFPQADNFSRVLDMLEYLSEKKDKYELAAEYEFDVRQSDYYANALVYLGMVDKIDNYFLLNDLGRKIKEMPNDNQRNHLIIMQILKHQPFSLALDATLKNNKKYDKKFISDVLLSTVKSIHSLSTAERRTQTVISWINWIFSVIKE